jgi:hypothetical protein
VTAGLVAVDPRARRAWPWLPALVKAGRVLVGPTGEVIRVDDRGHLEFVVTAGQPWHRSVASDPCPSRAA